MAQPNADPSSIDFAALNLLRVVHELGSFTAAAEKLNINQSAVSYTIAKLRACFHDPLFVREGGRQVSTDRCEEILARSLQMLGMLDEMLQPDAFDPGSATQNVTIACNYYERVLLIPALVSAIRREAPGMTVKVINALGDGHLRLLNREADVLIGPFARQESGFHSRRLYVEEYACLMDAAHPLADATLDIGRYLGLNHVLIDYGGGWQSAYLRELEAGGAPHRAGGGGAKPRRARDTDRRIRPRGDGAAPAWRMERGPAQGGGLPVPGGASTSRWSGPRIPTPRRCIAGCAS